MSNKKLFWIAFFILSFCEFAQIAYSKTVVTSNQTTSSKILLQHCQQKTALQRNSHSNVNRSIPSTLGLQGQPISYSLPK